MKRTILITGPIGGGKSSVCGILASRGYPVYDCDSRTKAMYGSIPGLKEGIEKALGVPFCRIGDIFSDAGKMRTLEEILYPLVREDIEHWREGLDDGPVFVESATMMDKPVFDGLYDEVWMVEAPELLRHLRNPKAAEREGLQRFERNVELITRRIVNDGSLEELNKKIEI